MIDLDSIIKDYVHVSPGSIICAGSKIGQGTLIGKNKVIFNNRKIGKSCKIGNRLVIDFDIPDFTILNKI